MSITARHKRPGAFRLLVNSLETTPLEKRTTIIQAIAGEDPEMAGHIEKSLFAFEEFESIDDLSVAELLGEFVKEMRTVALALFKCKSDTLLQKFVKNMIGPQAFAFKEETELLTEVKLREQLAAQFRLIAKARELQASDRLNFKRYAGSYPGNL